MSNETQALLQAIQAAHAAGEEVALVTVTRVIGSAYRREGARMMVTGRGQSACMISGGCLEQEMIEVAMQTLARGVPERTIFDYAEEKSWWPGCGGTVEVRIEPLTTQSLSWRWLQQSLSQPSVLATVLSGGEGQIWLDSSGGWQGSIQPQSLEQSVVQTAQTMLQHGSRPTTRYLSNAEVFFDLATPPPQLVLLGAGHDAVPMANLALVLGFEVTVVDGVPERLAAFAAARTLEVPAEELAQKLALQPHHHVIVMNHHLVHDRLGLRFALESPARYVGVLGPRSRLEKMLAALATEGFVPTAEQWSRLRNPIGLDIGAESPEEIALAALGEILAVGRGYTAGFLHDRKGGIHQPARLAE